MAMFSNSFVLSLIWVACFFSTVAVGSANYSVQLLERLAPAGWTAESWAAVVDGMIGKTQAHVCDAKYLITPG